MTDIANNKRIARNTIILYVRMFVMMVISFFTARVTLRVLGVVDYGIMNVVGGLLSVTTIITAVMGSATQRFLAYELGKKDINGYRNVFSMLLNMYLIIGFIILLLGEIIGPWAIAKYLVIPHDRLIASQWLFQSTLICFVIKLACTPYNSSLIAYEKMDVYAYMTFYDAGSKLLIVFLLYLSIYDKLETFAILSFCISIVGTYIYYLYSKKHLSGCKYKLMWDGSLFKTLMNYTGWNFFGSTTGTLNGWGMNIILNLFFGPSVNAAKGIGDSVNYAVVGFCTNFYSAVSPQIIKTYAAGDIEYSKKLVCKSSKFSFFMLLILSVPLLMLTKEILMIWLGKKVITLYMIQFSQCMLVFSLVNILEQPITTIIRATGNIKNYELFVGILTLTIIPLTYLIFKIGMGPVSSIICMIIVYMFAHFIRMIIVSKQVGLSMHDYSITVLIPILLVSFASIGISLIISQFVNTLIQKILFLGFGSFAVTLAFIYMIGLTSNEQKLIRAQIKHKLFH